ncbi:hypothetical protein PoB_001658000 [Plakobranchus ocellatus]|uniref:Uncharacterized protein n=1 Tax=Plakobranchus ocellatus TaxID=259542 RepID=A0AAV3Z4L1_9GAST|nr:hypothetical protein PoB_001658000 [Plakobranchus ocellatus]
MKEEEEKKMGEEKGEEERRRRKRRGYDHTAIVPLGRPKYRQTGPQPQTQRQPQLQLQPQPQHFLSLTKPGFCDLMCKFPRRICLPIIKTLFIFLLMDRFGFFGVKAAFHDDIIAEAKGGR